jgi:hemoglobin
MGPSMDEYAEAAEGAARCAVEIDGMNKEFRSVEQRRAEIVSLVQKETGIDETMIETLIRGFYARVRRDPLRGPVFEARIAEWDPHLENMFAFWSSLTLQSGRYHGQPMAKHLPLPVDAAHFDRWLALFEATARDLCPPDAAQLFIERARRVAESLELGVAGANGVVLGKGERYRREQSLK